MGLRTAAKVLIVGVVVLAYAGVGTSLAQTTPPVCFPQISPDPVPIGTSVEQTTITVTGFDPNETVSFTSQAPGGQPIPSAVPGPSADASGVLSIPFTGISDRLIGDYTYQFSGDVSGVSCTLVFGVIPVAPPSSECVLTVSPNPVVVGQNFTITGTGFVAVANQNTVVVVVGYQGGLLGYVFADSNGTAIWQGTIPGARAGASYLVGMSAETFDGTSCDGTVTFLSAGVQPATATLTTAEFTG